ncbi:MAG TPA: phosphate ABC transporter substrate-binding protein [Armatimonadota bacterium]|jgi:phosphate transport system substrate-binding protein
MKAHKTLLAGIVAGLSATLALGLVGCSKPQAPATPGPVGAAPTAPTSGKSIQIKGSDTMVNLGQAWAEAFGAKTGAQVMVSGGGSGTGFAALLSGTCDVAEASRMIEPQETADAKAKGINPKEYKVALDGLAVIVNPKNPVSKLTIDQLADIFTGRVKNWKEVGGPDAAIVILSRDVNSGTHVYFKEHVLRKGNAKGTEEFAETALPQSSSQGISDEVAQNDKAIGYVGMGYLSPKVKSIEVAKTAAGPYVGATAAHVLDGTYPISRPLLFYTNGEPQGLVKEYMDFVLSPEGQKIVEEQEFVPVGTSATKPSA